MKIKSNHYEILDILKGIAIFMVVWGHLIDNENILYRYLNNLHLPLFFGISGFLLANSLTKYSCKVIFIKKLKRLLLPFFSWSVVALISKTIIAILQNRNLTFTFFQELLVDVFIEVNSVWFLWVLFLGTCTILFMEKWKYKKIGFLILISGLIFLPNNIFKLGKLKIMFPIFYLGYFLFQKKDLFLTKINSLKNKGAVIGVCFLLLLYFIYNKEMFIAFTEFNIAIFSSDALWYLYYWFIQFCGIFFSACIIYRLIKKKIVYQIILSELGNIH